MIALQGCVFVILVILGGCAGGLGMSQTQRQRVDTFCYSQSNEQGVQQCQQFYAKNPELIPPNEAASSGNYVAAATTTSGSVAQMPQANLPYVPPPPASYSAAPASLGEIEVPLVKEAGVLTVPILINGVLSLDFTIDSGAADVAIPADVVLVMIRTGTLRRSDFLGTKTYTLADGSTIPSTTFRIRTLTVGHRVIENVVGSMSGVEGSLLLGQSFLNRFRSWAIDNQRQVLVLD
jgi:predicted aspartyl protease